MFNENNESNNPHKLRVFLMGGTKDSINIIKFLKETYDSPYILTTTTTDYGGKLAKEAGSDDVIDKALPKSEILDILKNYFVGNDFQNRFEGGFKDEFKDGFKGNFDVFIDATHPFAAHVTSTAIEVSKIANIPYIRFERPSIDYSFHNNNKNHNHNNNNNNNNSNLTHNSGNIFHVDSFEEIGDLLATKFNGKKVLHLAGVNTIESVLSSLKLAELDEIDKIADFDEIGGSNKSNKLNRLNKSNRLGIDKKNFFVRALPVKSSIEKCNDLGIFGEHIIAMQGVFSKEFNKSLMKELAIDVIITKESGDTGGVPSKIAAAHDLGIDVILVNRPKITNLDEENIVNDLSHLKKQLDFYII